MLKQPSHRSFRAAPKVARAARWFAAFCVAFAAAPAAAQEADGPKSGQVRVPAGEDAPPAEAPKEGSVGAMGAPAALELDEGAVADSRKTLLWIGFHNAKSYSRLFIKTSARVAVEALPGPGQLVLRLKQARSRLRNNLRYIDTSYFPTAVYRVTPRKADEDVDVVVQMREVVGYKVKRKGETLYVDFDLPAKK